MKRFLPLQLLSALACLPVFAQGVSEDFESASLETPIGSSGLAGWRMEGTATENGALVLADAAYSSEKGVRLGERETFVIYEADTPFWTEQDGPLTFRMNFRLNGRMPLDVTLHNGSTASGYKVIINNRTEELILSNGEGESIFRCETLTHPLKDLQENVWYTLEIRDATLAQGGAPAAGKVYLYETESPASLLVDGLTIVGSGRSAPHELRTFQVRRWGTTNESLDIDDVQIGSSAANN